MTESKNSKRLEQPPSELRSALCGVNENIVIFTLFCDILDQIWSLLKYGKKCELWFYDKFEYCVRIF